MDKKPKKLKVNLNKKNIIVIGTVISVLAVAVIVFSFLTSEFHTAYSDSPSSTESMFSSIVSSDSDNRVSFTGNDIVTVKSFSSRMFVLTEKLLACVDSDGEIRYTKVHNYANPAIEISTDYGILFNRNSQEYMIFTTKGVIYEGKSEGENDIIAAAINKEGTFALSTKSDSSASMVSLYTKKGKVMYIWACGEEYVVTLDVHTNSRKIAAGAIGAKEGEIISKTYLLDIYSDKAVCDFALQGSGITDIRYEGKNIISVFNDRRLLYDVKSAKGAPEKSKYVNTAVSCFTDESGNTAVISDAVSGFDKTALAVYDTKNRVKYTMNLDGKPTAVTLRGKTSFVASGDVVYEVSPGKIRNTYKVDFNIDGLVLCSGKVFAYSSGILSAIR